MSKSGDRFILGNVFHKLHRTTEYLLDTAALQDLGASNLGDCMKKAARDIERVVELLSGYANLQGFDTEVRLDGSIVVGLHQREKMMGEETETITESEWVRRKFAEIERRLEEMRRLINEPTGDSFKTNKRGGIGEG